MCLRTPRWRTRPERRAGGMVPRWHYVLRAAGEGPISNFLSHPLDRTLPMRVIHCRCQTAVRHLKFTASGDAPMPGKQIVMVVDDDDAVRNLCCQFLQIA